MKIDSALLELLRVDRRDEVYKHIFFTFLLPRHKVVRRYNNMQGKYLLIQSIILFWNILFVLEGVR